MQKVFLMEDEVSILFVARLYHRQTQGATLLFAISGVLGAFKGGGMMDERVSPARNNMWTSGAAYEQYVGRWSRQVAREFLKWVVVPPGRRWLDVGCGPGALSQAILDQAAPSAVMGIDPSTDFIAFARAQVRDGRARFEVGDARSLPSEAGRYDAVVSGLVLNFVPQPDLALAEMVRVTRPGGSVAVYVWDYAGQMQWIRYFWDAAVALDPAAWEQDEGRRFPLCQPEALAGLFRSRACARWRPARLISLRSFAILMITGRRSWAARGQRQGMCCR